MLIKDWFFNATVAVVLAATLLLIWRVFNPTVSFSACHEEVAAMRIPSSAISNLYSLSQWYDVPFDQLLAMYAISNDFFPTGSYSSVELDVLKNEYVSGFNRLRRQYAAGDIRPYFDLFRDLLTDLQHFPLPQEYDYIFSDTWSQPRGTAILDQSNIPGRIPVLSMTAGRVSQSGWHARLGYHVVIITENNNRFLYAHLYSLAEKAVTLGQPVLAGQTLGTIGNSGEAQQVHLHIGISPSVSFAKDFWINPYPFLQHLEEKMYIFPNLVHTNYHRGTILYMLTASSP